VTWREAVLSSLKAYSARHSTRVIQRQRFIDEEIDQIVLITGTDGATPTQTLSRVFQDFRDTGSLRFLTPGEYLFLDEAIDVELEDLTDDAIDAAIRANRLRIGIVATDTKQTLVRQRKGQSRLRSLTIENYISCCAVCDIADPKLLVASHIIGWAKAPEHRGNLANVICLCRIHDPLFELGHWSLDDDLRILRKAFVQSRTLRRILEDLTVFRTP
jgi:putative restriction endonuclease